MSQNESFESQLRGIAPVANGVSLEQVLYRAGYESGRQSFAHRATSWYSFAKGAVSGIALSGAAASGLLVLMMNGSPRQEPESTQVAALEQIAITEQEQRIVEEPEAMNTPAVDAPRNPFLSPIDEDPIERSIQQIVKQRWNRQRLSQRTKWISTNDPSSAQGQSVNSSATGPKSLFELRNSTEWFDSL